MSDRERQIDGIRQSMTEKVKKFDRPIWGYKKVEEERQEGDTWEDSDGKQWIIKNGIKQTISKTQDARMPWFCPKCELSMNHRFDDKFWRLYGMCYNCTIKWHTQMKIDGTYDAWERKIHRDNEKAYLKDMIAQYKDYIRTFRVPQVHYQNGGWDNLAQLHHFSDMFDQINRDIKICEEKLKQIEQEEQKELEKTV